ncbi:MAG: STAS domain-containing protein [Alphaproteobacteria bacterium]|nr:STAS domain-containing protein [Alphaproteobacteria bacterium]
MEIVEQQQQGKLDVMLSGLFTFNDHPDFRRILQKIEDQDVEQIVFHMDKVEFVDSAALGMLLLALDAVEKNQKRLLIQGATGQVKKMFDLARFHTLFSLG